MQKILRYCRKYKGIEEKKEDSERQRPRKTETQKDRDPERQRSSNIMGVGEIKQNRLTKRGHSERIKEATQKRCECCIKG